MSRIRRFVDLIATPLGRFVIIVDDEGRLRVSGFAERHARVERELSRQAARPDGETRSDAELARAIDHPEWLLFHERGAAQQRAFAFAAPDARRR